MSSQPHERPLDAYLRQVREALQEPVMSPALAGVHIAVDPGMGESSFELRPPALPVGQRRQGIDFADGFPSVSLDATTTFQINTLNTPPIPESVMSQLARELEQRILRSMRIPSEMMGNNPVAPPSFPSPQPATPPPPPAPRPGPLGKMKRAIMLDD